MRITKSNVLLGLTPTVNSGASTDLPSNITNQDFSLFYKSSDQNRLSFDFGPVNNINYVAFAGINIEGDRQGGSRVRVYDGDTLIRTLNTTSNRTMVVHLGDPRNFSNLRVGIYNDLGDTPPILNFVAAGLSFEVPNGGETSGYTRQYLDRPYSNVSNTNKESAPINQLRKRLEVKGRLNLPNMTRSFCEGELDDFFIFSQDNLFFISEQDDVFTNVFSGSNPSSYLCYDVDKISVKAHQQTRTLNNVSFGFKVFNGL